MTANPTNAYRIIIVTQDHRADDRPFTAVAQLVVDGNAFTEGKAEGPSEAIAAARAARVAIEDAIQRRRPTVPTRAELAREPAAKQPNRLAPSAPRKEQ